MSPPRSIPSRHEGTTVHPAASPLLRLSGDDFLLPFQKFETEASGLKDFYAREERVPDFLQRYFRDARVLASLRFGETTLVVENSPDLHLREGAGLCAEARIQDGQLSFPQPLRLGGFYALAGLYEFCSVDTDEEGRVRLKSCSCSLPKDSDISEAALQGPLASLFPEQRVHPVSLRELAQSLNGKPASADSPDPLLAVLQSLQAKVQIPTDHWIDDPPGTPGGSCHPQWASLEAYLNLPRLKQNLAAGLWRNFDFSGVERGSKILWPRFNLADLPLPAGWSIPEGRADLELRYYPEAGETQIHIRRLEARAKIPALLGAGELKLAGEAEMTLRQGGEVELKLRGLRVEAPLNSGSGEGWPNLSVSLDGTAIFQSGGGGTLKALRLEMNDLQWQVPETNPSEWGEGFFGWGTLLGQGRLAYDGEKDRWTRLELELTGDLSLKKGESGPLLRLEGIGFDLRGDEKKLDLRLDAVHLKYGSALFRPEWDLQIQPRLGSEPWQVQGKGRLNLRGLNLPLSLATEVEFEAGTGIGKLKLQELALEGGGRAWTRKGRLQADWGEKGLRGRLVLPDLPGGMSLNLNIRRRDASDRLTGHFDLHPSRQSLGPGLWAEDLRLRGSFVTDPLSELLTKPRTSLRTKLRGSLKGLAEGPFQAELQGSLRYSPERRSIFLWLNPRRNSALSFGPLQVTGEKRPIEGELPLRGTWQAVLLPSGVLVGGRGVGVQGGEIRIREDSISRPLIENFELIADQLWSIQKGMAYAGGTGIRLEGSFDTSAWLGSSVQGLGKRKVFLAADRLPLSLDSYWKLFAASLKTEEEGR